MFQKMNRRDFVKAAALGGTMATAAGMSALPVHATEQFLPLAKKREIPTGTIAGVEFSRMMLGGNLLTHHTHSRDLHYVSRLAGRYNTPQKVHETMRIAEEYGINTVVIHTQHGVLDGLKQYRERGGNLKIIICSIAPITDDMDEYTQSCQECIDAGVDALYLWGCHADAMIDEKPRPNAGGAPWGRSDLIKKAVNTMRSFGVPVGVAAHHIEVIEFCEQEGIKNDFYLKTFHHRNYPSAVMNYDNSWCDDPEKHIEVFSKIEKPWIAYKVMAAGAIPPRDALEYTFSNGADFVIFGMFDYEIDEDTRLLNEVLALDGVKNRARKWFG
ncbi:MAG: twin-arginine translocation signal domain-containing protein [Planctomycetaceae bacterium]|nr:twin-arginine translocation signal domain-containing protein [Planctomycetaceae bacterium]